MTALQPRLMVNWRRPVPRIEPRLTNSVIYLYKSAKAAEQGEPGGSGFLVGEPSSVAGFAFLFAVTNNHVARDHPVIRLAGVPRDGRIVVRDPADWYRHPDNDDVMVTPLGLFPEDQRDGYIDFIPRDWFVVPEDFTEFTENEDGSSPRPVGWPYGPGEDVVMIGRFLGHDGTDVNRPAARYGNLSIESPVPIKHKLLGSQMSFVIECKSLSGYSGSPVFIWRPRPTFGAGMRPLGREGSSFLRLLGIDWGNLDRVATNTYEVDWLRSPSTGDHPSTSGMMVAVPSWRLAELLDSDEVKAVQKAEEDKFKQEVEAEGATLDFTAEAEFGRFQDLTRRLLTVPKSEIDALRAQERRGASGDE